MNTKDHVKKTPQAKTRSANISFAHVFFLKNVMSGLKYCQILSSWNPMGRNDSILFSNAVL